MFESAKKYLWKHNKYGEKHGNVFGISVAILVMACTFIIASAKAVAMADNSLFLWGKVVEHIRRNWFLSDAEKSPISGSGLDNPIGLALGAFGFFNTLMQNINTRWFNIWYRAMSWIEIKTDAQQRKDRARIEKRRITIDVDGKKVRESTPGMFSVGTPYGTAPGYRGQIGKVGTVFFKCATGVLIVVYSLYSGSSGLLAGFVNGDAAGLKLVTNDNFNGTATFNQTMNFNATESLMTTLPAMNVAGESTIWGLTGLGILLSISNIVSFYTFNAPIIHETFRILARGGAYRSDNKEYKENEFDYLNWKDYSFTLFNSLISAALSAFYSKYTFRSINKWLLTPHGYTPMSEDLIATLGIIGGISNFGITFLQSVMGVHNVFSRKNTESNDSYLQNLSRCQQVLNLWFAFCSFWNGIIESTASSYVSVATFTKNVKGSDDYDYSKEIGMIIPAAVIALAGGILAFAFNELGRSRQLKELSDRATAEVTSPRVAMKPLSRQKSNGTTSATASDMKNGMSNGMSTGKIMETTHANGAEYISVDSHAANDTAAIDEEASQVSIEGEEVFDESAEFLSDPVNVSENWVRSPGGAPF